MKKETHFWDDAKPAFLAETTQHRVAGHIAGWERRTNAKQDAEQRRRAI